MLKTLTLLFFQICTLGVYAQNIVTVAGDGSGGYTGDGGLAINASIGNSGFIAFDREGNLFISEFNNTIRKVSNLGIITKIAGTGVSGFSGDGALAVNAKFDFSGGGGGIAFDKLSNLYVADYLNHRVRKINVSTGVVTTIAGTGVGGFGGDNGPAISAILNGPISLAFDAFGNLYISDGLNYRIRKVDTNGIITTIAGTGTAGYLGDGGAAFNAEMYSAAGMKLDNFNNLVFADGFKIRKINLSSGIITSIAGNGLQGFSGDGGLANSAELWLAIDVAIDNDGVFYISDMDNNRIRKVTLASLINTVVGTGVGGYGGDDSLALNAKLHSPRGVTLDSCGNLYISDNGNGRIRKVTFNPNCNLVDTTDTSTAVHVIAKGKNDINIYPNPATDEIKITGTDKSDISIINTLGQVLIEQKQYAGQANVNVRALNAGVYYVVVRDRVTGEKVTRRFVKK